MDGLSIRALPGDYISKPGMRPGFQEGPMKYLCLIYDHEQTMAGMSEADANAFMGEYFAFTNGIKASGHYVAGEVLKPVNTANDRPPARWQGVDHRRPVRRDEGAARSDRTRRMRCRPAPARTAIRSGISSRRHRCRSSGTTK